jgi:excisionase family DNA binding protein
LNEFGEQYLTIDELSSYIRRSKGAIRNLVLRRAIPYRKPAGRLIFIKDEIDRWVQEAPGEKLDEM